MPSWEATCCILLRPRSFSVSANFTTRLDDAPCLSERWIIQQQIQVIVKHIDSTIYFFCSTEVLEQQDAYYCYDYQQNNETVTNDNYVKSYVTCTTYRHCAAAVQAVNGGLGFSVSLEFHKSTPCNKTVKSVESQSLC